MVEAYTSTETQQLINHAFRFRKQPNPASWLTKETVAKYIELEASMQLQTQTNIQITPTEVSPLESTYNNPSWCFLREN